MDAPLRESSLAANLPPVCRLGLASRGNTNLTADDVHRAIAAGVNYLNWCGQSDGMSRAIRELGSKRKNIVIAAQLSAESRSEMDRELDAVLAELKTDCLDVPTFYWMENREQWARIRGTDGAWGALHAAKMDGRVRLIGVTSHQRKLAAEIAASGETELLMIRYNAAHTGAERDIFPVTASRKIPVVAYTCLRWGALLKPTPDDPADFTPPPAPAWYRWALQNENVAVAIMAPYNRVELEENLTILSDWRGLSDAEWTVLCEHGKRVYKHAGSFP